MLKGQKLSKETKEKISKAHVGYKFSEEAKKKMSLVRLGKKFKPHSEETKKKIGLANSVALKGKKQSLETRKKRSQAQKGEKGSNWQAGICQLNKAIRNSLEYKLWREAIFTRDNWRSSKGNPVLLNADHIKPFSLYPELRFALDNGRTLCIDCHKKTDTYMGRTRWQYRIDFN